MNPTVELIALICKRLTPIDTGQLRRSIVVYIFENEIIIMWLAPYAEQVNRKYGYMETARASVQKRFPNYKVSVVQSRQNLNKSIIGRRSLLATTGPLILGATVALALTIRPGVQRLQRNQSIISTAIGSINIENLSIEQYEQGIDTLENEVLSIDIMLGDLNRIEKTMKQRFGVDLFEEIDKLGLESWPSMKYGLEKGMGMANLVRSTILLEETSGYPLIDQAMYVNDLMDNPNFWIDEFVEVEDILREDKETIVSLLDILNGGEI